MSLWLWWTLGIAHGADDDRWQQTLDTVTRSVVSIRMDRPRAYDGKGRSNSQATGFVIDAEQGLILTNRHVVTAGPTTAEALFLNHEEVELQPVYRDPVHDFGLFRYDPDALRFLEPDSLKLRPDKARVGVEVRVVGNDSGEQLSILDGTLARLDRAAPSYGPDFNDFNTFYLQAASSTSGGSSGSPVVDIDGDVVGLNAGGKRVAASSFYLPLDRVVRAVDLIREGEAVSRGTLQTTFEYVSYAELRRLGLSEESEAAARERDPDGTGLLVARIVLPEGPADGALRVGDVLLELDGTPVHDFVTLEGILDGRVGEAVELVVERAGERMEAEVTVGDLHGIIPSAILDVGGGTLHELSYHQARTQQVPVHGIYLAETGYMFRDAGVPRHSVILELDGEPVDDLEDFAERMAAVPDDGLFTLRWFPRGKPRLVAETAVRMDRTWFGQRLCTRDDDTGTWPCLDSDVSLQTAERLSVRATFPDVDDKVARRVQPSLVVVHIDVPYRVGGAPNTSYVGGGVVLDADQGLVLVDRDTLPIGLADVRLTIAGAVDVPGRVVALHPTHNVAIVGYDPALVSDIPLQAASFVEEPLEAGDDVWFVGLDSSSVLDVQELTVVDTEPFGLRADGPPRFRESHLDVLALRPDPPDHNGVLVDKKGRVGGYWASFSYHRGRDARATWRAIPARIVQEALALARGDTDARALGWELSAIPLPDALERGLPPAEAERLLAHQDGGQRRVLLVTRTQAGDPLSDEVQTGDLVVAVQGRPVATFTEVERAIAGRDEVTLALVRGGERQEVTVPTQALSPVGIDRVLLWSGIRLHAPHRAAQMQGVTGSRPYVAFWSGGSPAGRAKVYPQRVVLSVDGVDTPDLDAFIEAVRDVPDGASVRLELEDKDGEREVLTIEPDRHWWPTVELRWEDGAWVRDAL